MEPYSAEVETRYKLSSGDSWLRKRQGLALPVLPPTTPEARKFFFSTIQEFAAIASESGKSKINFEAFAQEWNQSANGEHRFYVTTEVLSAYSKTWEKSTNIQASQELISDQLEVARQTANVFAAEAHPVMNLLFSHCYRSIFTSLSVNRTFHSSVDIVVIDSFLCYCSLFLLFYFYFSVLVYKPLLVK